MLSHGSVSVILGRDFRAEGLTLERVGFGEITKDEYLGRLEEGFAE